MEETKVVTGAWELSTFKFRVEGEGLRLMLENMKDKKLVGTKCSKCGTVYIPGNFYCRKCHVKIDEQAEVSDHGTVMSYTVGYSDVRGNPLEEPRIAVEVKLDGGDTWIMGVMQECKPEDMEIGKRVKVKWNEVRSGSLQDMKAFIPE
ncbi:MAG: OB-fold domain-containing protein [Actinomycetota bacterium]|nr:OB-fold domain-containing protein [Actinomycetota bacterium]